MNLPMIIRRIDELGRVAIPKEFRRVMGIKEGDFIEIYFDKKNGQFILKVNKEEE